ncbi:MAG: DUF190 domain-containing protein [Ferrovum sp.]|jgi:PII-like signaling protein|uniref:DUF190 domain-containing protein n=1 Tax=Ferrovum sp. TaxID=2609467 RepID=UPI0026171CAC|nr:DUF190 domain-containing protein [Ferrovum sp.]MBW8067910.1 DUF190 domain-containing protein [Ferrovum sp.]
MKGTYLKFYLHENRQHHHVLAYEWLLEQARALGIQGGSVFKSIAGYGRHGVLHEDHFFELGNDLPVEVVFVLSPEQSGQLLNLVREAGLPLLYVTMPVEYGILP